MCGACQLLPYVDPPQAIPEGEFLVHVVTKSDESLPKILTWYTGSALSQPIVVRHNPFLAKRGAQIGDRIRIPLEIVANNKRYATDASDEEPRKRAPDLLMEGKTERRGSSSSNRSSQPSPDPGRPLEIFNDDTNPDGGEPAAENHGADPERINRLEREIQEKQRELEELKGRDLPERFEDEDMPPPIPSDMVQGS
jgi:hypothetical protein